MLKQFLIPAIILFQLHTHAKSMLVDPLHPLSNKTLIKDFLNEVLQTIKKQPDTINDTNEDGYTLLQQALINHAFMENSISQMQHINGPERDILNNNIVAIKVLLNNGANPNIPFPPIQKSHSKEKPQHFLIRATEDSAHPRFPLHIVELLFAYGLDAEARDSKDNTALMRLISLSYAWRKVSEYRANFIQLIVRHTNDINAQNESKETALHQTSTFNDLQTARLLIQSGARLDIRNTQGDTPEEKAKFMAGPIPPYKANRRWYWHFSFSSQFYKMIKLLQQAKTQLTANGSQNKEENENPLNPETPINPPSRSCESILSPTNKNQWRAWPEKESSQGDLRKDRNTFLN